MNNPFNNNLNDFIINNDNGFFMLEELKIIVKTIDEALK